MSAELESGTLAVVEPCWNRIVHDLALLSDAELAVENVRAEIVEALPTARGGVHVAFKFGVEHAGRIRHGCLLAPLPDAITLACLLIMLPGEHIAQQRERTSVDQPLREALLEVSTWIARSLGASLRSSEGVDARIEPESCQGVRADLEPAVAYEPGERWIASRAELRHADWPAFEAILLVPELAVA
jgi:hypothetical protein